MSEELVQVVYSLGEKHMILNVKDRHAVLCFSLLPRGSAPTCTDQSLTHGSTAAILPGCCKLTITSIP